MNKVDLKYNYLLQSKIPSAHFFGICFMIESKDQTLKIQCIKHFKTVSTIYTIIYISKLHYIKNY